MKLNSKSMILLGGVAAAVAAASAHAQTVIPSPVGTFTASTTSPWTTYSYTSPQLSVYSGVQFGSNQNTNVNQSSARNISGFAQVGNNVSATVTQSGVNTSSLAQVGRNTSALIFQFGK